MAGTSKQTLLERAREAIKVGRLPCQRPARSWGGEGTGAACAICGEQIGPKQLEYELEFTRAGSQAQARVHVHLQCCSAWELERLALQSTGSARGR